MNSHHSMKTSCLEQELALQRWRLAVFLDCRSPSPLTDPSKAALMSKLFYYFQPNAVLFMDCCGGFAHCFLTVLLPLLFAHQLSKVSNWYLHYWVTFHMLHCGPNACMALAAPEPIHRVSGCSDGAQSGVSSQTDHGGSRQNKNNITS